MYGKKKFIQVAGKSIFLFALGGISSLAMAPTNFWPALFIGLGILYACIRRSETARTGGALGFMFSLGYFGFSLSWIGNALLVEGNPYWWAWPLAVSGLPLILSAFTFTGIYLYKRILKNFPQIPIINYLLFVTTLFFIDYARGNMFTGFPWNLYGYTWIDHLEIAQTAKLWNVYLLNGLTILWATSVPFIVCKNTKALQKAIITALSLSTFTGAYFYGHNALQHKKNDGEQGISISVVQPNIAQSEKWKQENRVKNFLSLLELSKYTPENPKPMAKEHYIIWPETAISQDLMNSEWVWRYIEKTLSEYPQPTYLITGTLRQEREDLYNSIIIINNNAEIVHTYNKAHLVPFGEYMPFRDIIDISPVTNFKGMEKGTKEQRIYTTPKNTKLSLLICYEVIFPEPSAQTDIIINVTNDAWYGDSAGPHQHLVQSRFRAIENNQIVIRSANTGISAIIDRYGRIKKSLYIQKKGLIHSMVYESI